MGTTTNSNAYRSTTGEDRLPTPTTTLPELIDQSPRVLSMPGLLWSASPAILRYGVAVLSVAVALIISRLLDTHLVSAPASLFLCAVMFSSWYGGVRAGLLAVALSLLAFVHYFVTPLYSLYLPIDEIPRVVIFLLSALFVGSLSSAQRSATESLKTARDDLSRSVQELKRTNEALQTENAERKRAEMLLGGEKRLLEMIARNDSPSVILDALCRFVEELASGCLSSILLLDPNTNCLRHGAAPSLPLKYSAAIDGIIIGPSVGSCGTAAYRKQPVVVSDIATDPLWADFRELALAHELRACWSTPILSSAGKVLGTFATYYREARRPAAQDSNVIVQITHLASIALERAQAEQALQQQANLLEQAHDAILIWEFPRTIVYWNRGAEQLYGFSREEAVGRPSHELLHTEHPLSTPEFEAALERHGEWTGELTHITRDGRKIIVESRHVLMNETDGRRLVLETNRDITDRKRAAAELREAQADLAHVSRVTTMGELTASLAHEVNQPIAAAVTNANTCVRWLAGDTPNIEEARAAAIRSAKDGTRAAEIISRIRLLFKKGTAERELIGVNEIIREMIVLLRGEATRYSVSIRTDLATDLPELMADRVQLQQVLMNLMLNAIDAMKETGSARELTIKSRQELDQILLCVSDTGVGLPPKQADQIFNAFFTTKLQGTGLGLSISRSIVESHGGRLWASANSPRGASFHLTLPIQVETYE
jgi:PAS domain S-box-containing protein